MLRKSIIVAVSLVLFLLTLEFAVRFRMDLVSVVMVKETLPQRTKISPEHLKIAKVSRHYLSEDAILDINSVKDVYVKMEHTLLEGSILRSSQIETLDETVDAPALLIHQDERVYTLKREVASILGGSIVRGSYVDLAVQQKKEDEYGIFLEKVRVVGVKDRNGLEIEKGQSPYTIQLAIHVDDINHLLRAEDMGTVVLLPRNIYDE